MTSCPICGQAAIAQDHGRDRRWNCQRCGRFSVDFELQPDGSIPADISHRISAYTRIRSGGIPPILTQAILDNIRNQPEKTREQKCVALLAHIEENSEYFGHGIKFDGMKDYALIGVKNANEVHALFNHHKNSGHLSYTESGHEYTVQLTVQGYQWLDEHRKAMVDSKTAFVAMWFNEEMSAVYKSDIEPAIVAAGYAPVRIDLVHHNGLIVGEILTQIRQSKFMVAEFTGHRGGVYFEAGFAKGLGLEVIFVCQENGIEEAHFDTNHFNHLLWSEQNPLREQLQGRIEATIGPGPLKKKIV